MLFFKAVGETEWDFWLVALLQAGSKVFDRGGAQPPKRGGAMGVSHGCAP